MIHRVSIESLVEHPKNNYFFDDITGQQWEDFLTSVQKNGIINPIVITNENVIVSGHQRVKACRVLGIKEINAYTMDCKSEDDIIIALIESNIRQRGVINSPSIKLGRIIRELERIYGIEKKDSGAGHPRFVGNVENQFTTNDIRDHLGISKDTSCYSRALAILPEEYEELIDKGVIGVSTAARIIAKLEPDQQVELFRSLDSTKRYTQKQIQEAITAAFPKANRIDELEEKLAEYQKNEDVTEVELRHKITELTQKERDSYEKLMYERKMHKSAISDYEKRMEKLEEIVQDSSDNDSKLSEYIEKITDLEEENEQLSNDAKIARNDADLILICSAVRYANEALKETSCDPSGLTGDLAVNALKYIDELEAKIEKIKNRIKAGENE